MAEYFTDTNVFLRFLTADLPDQAQSVDQLLDRAERGDIKLHTNVLTIAEIIWTLESYYGLDREGVRERILGILNTPGLQVENAEIIGQAMTLYVEENIDFVDAYNGLWCRENELVGVITFDIRHFNRIPDVQSFTPDEIIHNDRAES